MFGVVRIRAGDEVFEKQEVARAALDDGKEPVAELELAAARICLLREEIRGERRAVVWIGVVGCRRRGQIRHGRYGGRERGDEGVVEREIGKVREQDGGERGRVCEQGRRSSVHGQKVGEGGKECAVEIPYVDKV